MKRYMLDTNMVTHVLKNHPHVIKRLLSKPMASICISSITEGELMYGLAKRPEAQKLNQLVRAFLMRVEVLPWGSETALCYGELRAKMERQGKSLSSLDMLIAGHAFEVNATLVTHDQAFKGIEGLLVEDWLNPR